MGARLHVRLTMAGRRRHILTLAQEAVMRTVVLTVRCAQGDDQHNDAKYNHPKSHL
jgi:hypothetical protein